MSTEKRMLRYRRQARCGADEARAGRAVIQALGMRPETVFVVGIGNERADGEAASGAPTSPSRARGSDATDIVPARNDVCAGKRSEVRP